VRLAVNEFNDAMALRQLERHPFFELRRVFTRAIWVKQVFFLHVLDHPRRSRSGALSEQRYIENPYLPSDAGPAASRQGRSSRLFGLSRR
jgi:hypothetical protein